MKNLGQNTGEGFLPITPSLESLLQTGGILKEGYEGLKNTAAGKHLADGADKPGAELKRSYYRVFNGIGNKDDAHAVLEDILNQTLRRAMVAPKPGMTFEQLTPYLVERHGQNGAVTYMLKMIQDGYDLPPESKKKRKK